MRIQFEILFVSLLIIFLLQFGCDNKSNPVKSKNDTTQIDTNITDTTITDTSKLEIFSFSPELGERLSIVTIKGQNFDSTLEDNTVLFGDKIAILKQISINNDTSYIEAYVPYNAETDFIKIKTKKESKTSSLKFTVLTGDSLFMPKILLYRTYPYNPGIMLFLGQSLAKYRFLIKIYLADMICPIDYDYPNDKSPHFIKCYLPQFPRSGYFSVQLGEYRDTCKKYFFISDTNLIIEYFIPKVVIPNGKLLIYGRNFDLDKSLDTVYIGKIRAEIKSVDITQEGLRVIETIVPKNAQSNKIKVKVANSIAYSKENLLVERDLDNYPQIISFYPHKGQVGSKVKIKGLYFSKDKNKNNVYFGNLPSTIESIETNNDIVYLNVIVPENAKTCKITVKTGLFEVISKDVFVVPENRSPVIDGINPKFGIIGTDLTIQGKYLGDIPDFTSVYFGNTKSEIKSINNNKIVCTVPQIIKDDQIKISTQYGSTVSKDTFKLWHNIKEGISFSNINARIKSYYNYTDNSDTTYKTVIFKPKFRSVTSNFRISDTLNHISLLKDIVLKDSPPFFEEETTKFEITLDTVNKELVKFYAEDVYTQSQQSSRGGSYILLCKLTLINIPLQSINNNIWTFSIQGNEIENHFVYLHYYDETSDFFDETNYRNELDKLLPFSTESKITIKIMFDK